MCHHHHIQAFSTGRHPMGILMQRLEIVYKASYGGIGANKYLLPHAIAETHSLIQRIHGIVRYTACNHVHLQFSTLDFCCDLLLFLFLLRILFPMLSGGDQNVSQTGLMKVEGFNDPDDYVDIESGQYTLGEKSQAVFKPCV